MRQLDLAHQREEPHALVVGKLLLSQEEAHHRIVGERSGQARRERTEVGRYLHWLERERGRTFATYEDLQRWSVDHLEQFWAAVRQYFGVGSDDGADAVVERIVDTFDGAETASERRGAVEFILPRLAVTM